MKTLPRIPYLQNIVSEWHRMIDAELEYSDEYIEWLSSHGFKVPIINNYLEFPDDFTEQQMIVFMLRWG